MYSWQIERWAELCRLALDETDKNKLSREISEAYNAILDRLWSLHCRRKAKEELNAMKSAVGQLSERRKTL